MIYNKEEIIQKVYSEILKEPDFATEFFGFENKERLIQYHHSFGRYIRNEYGLWNSTWTPEIDEEGVDCSPNHPDAISMDIIEQIWERYRNQHLENVQ